MSRYMHLWMVEDLKKEGEEEAPKTFWTKIGIAKQDKDGSWFLELTAIPVDGKIRMIDDGSARDVKVERECRLKNEEELHRADKIIGELREEVDRLRGERVQAVLELERERTASRLLDKENTALRPRVRELEERLAEVRVAAAPFVHRNMISGDGHPEWGAPHGDTPWWLTRMLALREALDTLPSQEQPARSDEETRHDFECRVEACRGCPPLAAPPTSTPEGEPTDDDADPSRWKPGDDVSCGPKTMRVDHQGDFRGRPAVRLTGSFGGFYIRHANLRAEGWRRIRRAGEERRGGGDEEAQDEEGA